MYRLIQEVYRIWQMKGYLYFLVKISDLKDNNILNNLQAYFF